MDENYLKEKLNSIRSEMNHLWTGMLVTFGGAIGFMTVENMTILKLVFILLGIFMGILFINAYMIRRTELKNIIKLIKKEDK